MSTHALTMRLFETFAATHADEAACLLEEQPARIGAAALAACDASVAATVLVSMIPAEAAACLALAPASVADDIVAVLPVNKAANLLRRLSPEARDALLERLTLPRREPVEQLLHYPEGSVGAAMDPEVFALPGDLNVEAAMQRIRANAARVHYYLYIIDREQHLCGVLNMRDFILAEPRQRLGDIMKTRVTRLRPEMPLAKLPQSGDGARFLSMPVIDHDDTLLGVLPASAYRQGPQTGDSDRQPWDMFYAFSELYWLGLSRMLGTGAASGAKPDAAKDERANDADGD